MNYFTLTFKTLLATLLASLVLALAVYGTHVLSLKVIYFIMQPR